MAEDKLLQMDSKLEIVRPEKAEGPLQRAL